MSKFLVRRKHNSSFSGQNQLVLVNRIIPSQSVILDLHIGFLYYGLDPHWFLIYCLKYQTSKKEYNSGTLVM